MNRKIIIPFLILLFLIALVLVYLNSSNYNKSAYYESSKTDRTVENFRIYIPSSNSLLTKEIHLQKEDSELKTLEKILESFIAELSSPFRETKILGIYRDKENIIYLDLSINFASSQSLREEYFLIKALYKTLKENFSWIRDLKILIDSKEVETISGHISIDSYIKEILEES
ncbi:MAG: GerMN domain-containing protein [Thermodesulfovibrio sp.]|nr:GerMN domain-containing protein [Thermodesulfovibrio sp.]MDW7998895.1 GerMN domain-containing protein [Thermodesulfovibrio sp.]